MQGEARLRGLERIISQRPIRCAAPPVCAPAVGLKPSAMHGEARLRGLERNDYSKTNQVCCAPRMRLVPWG